MESAKSIFNINEYKAHLLSIGNWDTVNYPRSVCPTPSVFIESICQFETKPYEFLSIGRAAFGRYIHLIFKNYLEEKPHQAAPSKYLLHGFGYRKCAFCSQILPLDAFYKKTGVSSNWDKLRNDCISCEKAESLMIQNKDDINSKAKRYRDNNKDKIKKYRQLNTAKINSYTAQRRAKIKQQIGSGYSQEEEERYRHIIKYLSNRYNEPYVLDHYIPIATGGKHESTNWQIITKEENLYKNKINPTIFYSTNKGKWFLSNKFGIRKNNNISYLSY